MIGGLFGEADTYYTCEDGRTIVQTCAEVGVPLDFWSINNYAIASLGTELRAGDFGIAKHQLDTGLPVLLSETGHTSTETLHEGANERQAAAVPSQVWESILSGAMGVHIFTWNDRDFFSGDYFPREKGFGIVGQNRLPKDPAFRQVSAVFQRLAELDIANLVAGSTNPASDIELFWSQSSDLFWPRANQELNRVWNTLKRLGYQPGILRDEEFTAGAWKSARALMLSRSLQMDPVHLDTLATEVPARGIHVHAAIDLPGQFDAYQRPNPRWREHMNTLFGLEVRNAVPGLDSGATFTEYRLLSFRGVTTFDPLPANYSDSLGTWKYWTGITRLSGTTVVQHTGNQPALHLHDLGSARTAITPLALGDVVDPADRPGPHNWQLRYQWLRAIYRTYFGLVPPLDLSGPGSEWVYPDYRLARNGSVILGLLNGHTNSATVRLKALALLAGKTVENLSAGGIVEIDSDGEISLTLTGDQYVLLYATASAADSLINPSPIKLWFESAPSSVWPGGEPASVEVGYDTQGASVQLAVSLDSVGLAPRSHARSAPMTITGQGRATFSLPLPDADLNDPGYRSSRAGGNYVWQASTVGPGTLPARVHRPVRLLWAARPTALPATVQPGQTYPLTVNLEELPGYLPGEVPTAFDRADLWDSLASGRQLYAIVVELRAAGVAVVRKEFITRSATGTHDFTIPVPSGASGPFNWASFAQTAEGASRDIQDSFEGRSLGADFDPEKPEIPPLFPPQFAPWIPYHYAENSGGGSLYFNTGIRLEASHGSQSAFLVYTNPATVGTFSGFGMIREFPQTWSLPLFPFGWADYSFSCDLRERHGHRMNVALQIKSTNAPDDPTGWVHVRQNVQPYTAAEGDWQRISASLDQFRQEPFHAPFDRTQVQALVLNFEMLDTGVVYEVSVDNIRWDTPETLGLPGQVKAMYQSANDRPPPPRDSDADGVADAVETGTGIYLNPTNTGTRPDRADSDGDGQSDGDELIAGTDPNRGADTFRWESIRVNETGRPRLSWGAKSGRFYSVFSADGLTGPESEFFPVPGLTALSVESDGQVEVIDASPAPTQARFYRLNVQQP